MCLSYAMTVYKFYVIIAELHTSIEATAAVKYAFFF